jgi:hypothetical protein
MERNKLMGLDMYLEARKYIARIDWKAVPQGGLADGATWEDYQTTEYKELKEMFPADLVKHNEAGSSIAINVGYWRKANQIHGWFVLNVQGGEDNCGQHPVERDHLQELLVTVTTVLDGDKDTAKELLPVTDGPFFGNYDEEEGYDEYYYDQLRETQTMLTDILFACTDGQYDFYYQSSW